MSLAKLHHHRGSSLGSQYNARFRTAPAYTWGTAPVGAGSPRPYLKELESEWIGCASPGPVYNPPAQPGASQLAFSFGISSRNPLRVVGPDCLVAHVLLPSSIQPEQFETHKKSATSPSFGKATGRRAHRPQDATFSGPLSTQYAEPGVGKAVFDSRRFSASAYGFGSSRRFFGDLHHGNAVPGPGTYNSILPNQRRPATATFSRASRSYGSAFGTSKSKGPGPTAYAGRKTSSLGAQANSRHPSAFGKGFGTACRFPKELWYMDSFPGPGAYTP